MLGEIISMKKAVLVTAALWGLSVFSNGQTALTIEKALDIAEKSSPTLRRSLMSLERYQENLTAQRASLKSKISLKLDP